jgi:hypothetical protein
MENRQQSELALKTPQNKTTIRSNAEGNKRFVINVLFCKKKKVDYFNLCWCECMIDQTLNTLSTELEKKKIES